MLYVGWQSDKVLDNWGGTRVLANVEEDITEDNTIIEFVDHGDEFICVVTPEETYIYGWFLNRKWEPDPEDIDKANCEWCWTDYLRKPRLLGKLDTDCRRSNDIYKTVFGESSLRDPYSCWKSKIYDRDQAQRKFDYVYDRIKGIYYRDDTVGLYHSGVCNDIKGYLIENGIYEDNLEKLNFLRVYCREGAIDAVAGKKILTGDSLICDAVKCITTYTNCITEEEFGEHGIELEVAFEDEWGVESLSLDLDQFRKK